MTKAIIVARVSTRVQDEQSQVPGLLAFCRARAYDIARTVLIHGRSAYHGKHAKAILEAVREHEREATVCVFWDIDRMSRLEPEDAMRFYLRIRDHGYKVEFGRLPDLPFEMLPFLMRTAHEESKTKADRKLRGNARRRVEGKLVGSAPWGYKRSKDGGIEPTDIGREWVPRIFHLLAQGISARAVARRLTEAGVSSQRAKAWDGKTVALLARNTSYIGIMKDNPNLAYELLIDRGLFQQAGKMLDTRVRARGPVVHEPAFLKPICGECYEVERPGAPNGISPMYRLNMHKPKPIYRCAGSGPSRSSCGASVIPCKTLDETVVRAMATDTGPHLVPRWIPGTDGSEERQKLLRQSVAAIQAGDVQEGIRLAEQAQNVPDDRTEGEWALEPDGLTIGKHWLTLSKDEQREELGKYQVIAYSNRVRVIGQWKSPDEPGSNGLIEP